MPSIDEMMIRCIRDRKLLPEPVIKLRELLQIEGMECYLRLCGRRIKDSYFDAKDINIDLTDPDSLLITRAGLSKTADVILGYCDKEHFDRTCKILDDAKELFDTINEQLTYYRLLDNKTLRELKREEIVSNNLSVKNRDSIRICAAEELKARKLHKVLARKIVNFADNKLYEWEYRHILTYFKCTQDIDHQNNM